MSWSNVNPTRRMDFSSRALAYLPGERLPRSVRGPKTGPRAGADPPNIPAQDLVQ
jgi:hypothetical protein